MKFKIPFTFSNREVLKKRAGKLANFFKIKKRNSSLKNYLKSADAGLTREEYLAICLRSFAINFLVFSAIFTTILLLFKLNYLYGFGAGLLFSAFVLFNQLNYPKVYNLKKSRDLEKNLIPAMQDMLVQLSSGVPLFKILVNLSGSDYGEVSQEFGKAVREINSGKSQIEAIDDLGNRSSSLYFRRVLWQISNGMRSGSDMGIVIKENIDSLSKEQTIQIQSYGSKLNPLIMFYMLLTVILPALALTFLTILSSMLNLPALLVKIMFIVIFIFVVFVQIVFLGMIKVRRPSLL